MEKNSEEIGVMERLRFLIKDTFNLNTDSASMEEIKERIYSGGQVKGTNMCILILAMFIASIGLNMNSTAVIIGAMLISPLMGGIMSIGYGIAAYDTAHVRHACMGLIFQVVFCVIVSTIYFMVTPISTASSELLARTQPTVWDVLIACFGGLAGVIGTTRTEKTNVIPGVAIATALMPPLCTAGYGLAHRSVRFFGGAMYLFFINSFFICVSTILVLKIMRVPVKHYVSDKVLRKHKRYMILACLITVLPSIYMGYRIVKDSLETSQLKSYVSEQFQFDNTQVISYKKSSSQGTVEVAVIGKRLGDEEIGELQEALEEYSTLQKLTLRVIQNEYNAGVSKEDVEALIENGLNLSEEEKRIKEETDLKGEVEKYKKLLSAYYPAYMQGVNDQDMIKTLEDRAEVLFPAIEHIEGASCAQENEEGILEYSKFLAVVYIRQPMYEDEVSRLNGWMEKELNMEVVLNFKAAQIPEGNPLGTISGNDAGSVSGNEMNVAPAGENNSDENNEM